MNLRLVAYLLSTVSWLIGVTMAFSLPWALPLFGQVPEVEGRAFTALLLSITACLLVGYLLRRLGKDHRTGLYRKEAMAVVGLSWMLATLLGALPFWFSGTGRSCSVLLYGQQQRVQVERQFKPPLAEDEYAVIESLYDAPSFGLTPDQLHAQVEEKLEEGQLHDSPMTLLRELAEHDPDWQSVIKFPNPQAKPGSRAARVRLVWRTMNLADSLFESQSGFSTTGATVLTRLEDPSLVPRCILFWRSSTHFLGGLGIIVLFVAILGQGSAGKALMRAEMPGPSKEGSQPRMQHTALTFAGIYCGLNAILILILKLEGMSWFDAVCHAFGTMATGGFSTYDSSLGHFASLPTVNGPLIEYTVMLFMVLAGTNFTLLYFLLIRQPGRLLVDLEWRVYMAIILGVTALVVIFGMHYDDFVKPGTPFWQEVRDSVRFGLFQVISIMTTTGYGTHDFNGWNSFGRGVLFLLMFIGGCAGSTGGGLKVIRHILFVKILHLEIERSFHPSVVRPLRIGGEPVLDPDLPRNILVYFGLILIIFVFSWMLLVTIEPDTTWRAGGQLLDNKLIDAASSISATLNNIGPGLGIVGATQNYAHFTPTAKLLFTLLMMIGRLEIFVILVLFIPRFWRSY
jgi:trk system potassium uptake protein TrkH